MPADFQRAKELLATEGYHSGLLLPPAQEEDYLDSIGQIPFIKESQTCTVELHARITPRDFHLHLGRERLWPRIRPLSLNGNEVHALAGEDLLLVLCARGAKHHWGRLGWICDVAELLRVQPAMNWAGVAEEARALRAERILLLGLLLAHDLLQPCMPEDLLRQARGVPVVRTLAAQVWEQIFREADGGASGLNNALFRLRVRERLRDGLRYTVSLALTPTVVVWMALRVPARSLSSRIQAEEAMSIAIAEENLGMLPIIKNLCREPTESRRYGAQIREVMRPSVSRIHAALEPAIQFTAAIAVILLLGIAERRIAGGQMTPGALVGYLLYAAMLTRPIGAAADLYGQTRTARGTLERLHRVLGERPEPIARADVPLTIRGGEGEIVFSDVRFAYPGRPPALNGINLRVASGETIALTGPNGAGKSSLVHLLMRLYEPDRQILIDGVDIAKVGLHSLREKIGVVTRHTLLFNASVRDNIGYGDLDADDARIERAARLAQAHEFILFLPRGYDTLIGDGGVRLSGDQRQRIALDRALVKNPPILILDEATSMFDPEGEASFVHRRKPKPPGAAHRDPHHPPARESCARGSRSKARGRGRVRASGCGAVRAAPTRTKEAGQRGGSNSPDALICTVLRGEEAAWPETLAPDFATLFLERARYHGVEALLHERTVHMQGWPAIVRENLHRDALAAGMWEMRNQAVMRSLLDAFAKVGVRPILFKGAALAYSFYPNPILRSRADADLLILPRDRLQADRSMLKANVMVMEARHQTILSRIVPSDMERTAGTLARETVEYASQRFRTDGALILEDIVETALIAEARRVFGETYSHYSDGCEHEDALSVGELRLLITIDFEPPFDDPQLFANPYLLPVLEEVLDDGFVLGAFGVVCSLASAPAQHRHKDGGYLFPRTGLDRLLPASAITIGIPLLEMNAVNGTTGLWLGSHRDASPAANEEPIEPVVREGSCIFWDFRLSHGGTPNRGASPRPLLFLTYCRPWFTEYLNYAKGNPKQKPLLAKKEFWSRLSEKHQRLLARAR